MDALGLGPTTPNFHAAIRQGDWKLIQGTPGAYNGWYPVPGVEDKSVEEPTGPRPGPNDFQLFNIKEDPTEHFDVKAENPDVLSKMKARMEEWRKTMVAANFPPNDPASSPSNFDGNWSPGWC